MYTMYSVVNAMALRPQRVTLGYFSWATFAFPHSKFSPTDPCEQLVCGSSPVINTLPVWGNALGGMTLYIMHLLLITRFIGPSSDSVESLAVSTAAAALPGCAGWSRVCGYCLDNGCICGRLCDAMDMATAFVCGSEGIQNILRGNTGVYLFRVHAGILKIIYSLSPFNTLRVLTRGGCVIKRRKFQRKKISDIPRLKS